MKTILIHSGGLDSTVLLYWLRRQGHEVMALSVDYGQRHVIELQCAETICNALGVPFFAADLSKLQPLFRGSSQTDHSVPVPHGHYTDESMKKTVVPNRNMLLIAVAGAHAIAEQADNVAYAAHAGDHAIYPDCREEFVEPLARALSLADWHPVNLLRPFIAMTKAEIVQGGAEMGVPFHLTYSCYEGQPFHCGKCGTCVERREAFQLAGVTDPTAYRDDKVTAVNADPKTWPCNPT
jgi:7-cyano-7-deazaguanine synthase